MDQFSFRLLVMTLCCSISFAYAASLTPNDLSHPSASSQSIDDNFLAEQSYLLIQEQRRLIETSRSNQPQSLNKNVKNRSIAQSANPVSSPAHNSKSSESALHAVKTVFTNHVDEAWSEETLTFISNQKQTYDQYNEGINTYAQNLLEHLSFLNVSDNSDITYQMSLSQPVKLNTANSELLHLNEQNPTLFDSDESNVFSRFFAKVYRIQTLGYLFAAFLVYSFLKWLFNLILFRKFQNF